MFDLEDITAAHQKVKSGADFPKYVVALMEMGVVKYTTFVRDGHTIFSGAGDFKIKSEPKFASIATANIIDTDRFKHHLKSHQRGQIDFPAFRERAAETGVTKWTVDTIEMTCTYFDKSNNSILQEKIPIPI